MAHCFALEISRGLRGSPEITAAAERWRTWFKANPTVTHEELAAARLTALAEMGQPSDWRKGLTPASLGYRRLFPESRSTQVRDGTARFRFALNADVDGLAFKVFDTIGQADRKHTVEWCSAGLDGGLVEVFVAINFATTGSFTVKPGVMRGDRRFFEFDDLAFHVSGAPGSLLSPALSVPPGRTIASIGQANLAVTPSECVVVAQSRTIRFVANAQGSIEVKVLGAGTRSISKKTEGGLATEEFDLRFPSDRERPSAAIVYIRRGEEVGRQVVVFGTAPTLDPKLEASCTAELTRVIEPDRTPFKFPETAEVEAGPAARPSAAHSILVLDRSYSMNDYYDALVASATAHVNSVCRDGGLCTVIVFDDQAQVIFEAKPECETIPTAIGDGTDFAVAFALALAVVQRHPEFRSEITFFTDGQCSTDLCMPICDQIDALGCPIFVIGFGSGVVPEALEAIRRGVGTVDNAATAQDFDRQLAERATEITADDDFNP